MRRRLFAMPGRTVPDAGSIAPVYPIRFATRATGSATRRTSAATASARSLRTASPVARIANVPSKKVAISSRKSASPRVAGMASRRVGSTATIVQPTGHVQSARPATREPGRSNQPGHAATESAKPIAVRTASPPFS